jgi:RecQ zinc-binding
LFAFLINQQKETRQAKSSGKPADGSVKRKQDALSCVLEYCTKPGCRRQYILKHFGEADTDPETICQKSCDYCIDPQRIEQAVRASDSMRAITKQKEMAKKTKSANTWNGQWDKPHGDDYDNFFEGRAEDWDVEGLGITSLANAKPEFVGSKSFVSAKTLKSKLDLLEVSRCGHYDYYSEASFVLILDAHFINRKWRRKKLEIQDSSNSRQAIPAVRPIPSRSTFKFKLNG